MSQNFFRAYRICIEPGREFRFHLSQPSGLQMRNLSPKEDSRLKSELGAVPGPHLRLLDSELLPFSVFFGYLLRAEHSSGYWEFRSKQNRCLFSLSIYILGLGGKELIHLECFTHQGLG